MEDLLTTIEKRRVAIVRAVMDLEFPISLQKLESVVGSSVTVLRNDIRAMNKMMPQAYFVIKSNTLYSVEPDQSFYPIYRQIFR